MEAYLVAWAGSATAEAALGSKDWLRWLRRDLKREAAAWRGDRAGPPRLGGLLIEPEHELIDADALLGCLSRLAANGTLGGATALRRAVDDKLRSRATLPPSRTPRKGGKAPTPTRRSLGLRRRWTCSSAPRGPG